jgi:glutathione synthase/RimK-type ligase-like ATP-grasp enzyme
MTDSPVLLLGSPDDAHIAALARAIDARGREAVILDTAGFPERTRLSLGEVAGSIRVDGRDLGRPRAVYVRQLHNHPLAYGVDASEAMDHDWYATLVAFREKAEFMVALASRWEALEIPIYNSPRSDWLLAKPMQIAALERAGLPVPRSLWTNDPEAVREFARAVGRVAYKPISGGAATRELGPEDLDDERLEALSAAPVTFQELLPGDDLRVYVVDGAVVAAMQIRSSALDFRQHELDIEAIELGPELTAVCVRACEILGLRWTGMDLRPDARGTARILELNASPMFLGFDARAGTDVLGALADALTR